MRAFIIKGFAVLLIVVTVDIIIDLVYPPLITKLPNTGLSHTDSYYALNKQIADVLILGASNAKRGYNPMVFEEMGFKNVYNAALDGSEILYHLTVLKCIMVRRLPKIIILDINDNSLDGTWKYRIKLHEHLYKENKLVREMISNNADDYYIKIKSMSSLYRYNSSLIWVVRAFMIGNVADSRKGFDPLIGTTDIDIEKSIWDGKTDDSELKAFCEFIEICRKNNIELFISISPTYKKRDNKFSKFINDQVGKYGIRVLDYSNDVYFLSHKELFRDANHLNIEGAKEYTTRIAQRIKEQLQ